ncbi:MAG: UDP-2,3-diacylglucosamine diphosphatase LpxI [Alphaproteobacteria bacterium]|jgi:DUF1009 family protein|nr:UDP-2,3-diacylglucosamine diphosphatase LpxI [Alphaproteobacteria bacterium]
MKKSNKIKKPIGIIAGNGMLPILLIKKFKKEKIPFFVAGIEGDFKDAESLKLSSDTCKYYNLSQLTSVIKFFKKNGVREIVSIGGTSRPDFKKVKINFFNLKVLWKLFRSEKKGDDGLFVILKNEFFKKGLEMKSLHYFMPELLAEKKCYTKLKPTMKEKKFFEIGKKAAKKLGDADIGQAVITQNENIFLREDRGGTEAMLKKAGAIIRGFYPSRELADKAKESFVLFKMKKDDQLEEIDIPTIGINTIKQCHSANIKGVVIEAGSSYMIEKEKIIKEADKLNIFVVGI